MNKETFLSRYEDMDWLWSTHLKAHSPDRLLFASAMIHGNEDCPIRIELFKASMPKHNTKPGRVYLLQDDMSYKDETLCKSLENQP